MPCTTLKIGIGFHAIMLVKLQQSLAYSVCKEMLCLNNMMGDAVKTAQLPLSLDSIYRASAQRGAKSEKKPTVKCQMRQG